MDSDHFDQVQSENGEALIAGEVLRVKPKPELVDEIRKLLAVLHFREEGVLLARFGLGNSPPKTYIQIASEFAVTPERIREVESEAIGRLLELRISLGLKEYLK
jgi:DNA-directed RNA polymerase sigma subunit (sigma70/sigma32)